MRAHRNPDFPLFDQKVFEPAYPYGYHLVRMVAHTGIGVPRALIVFLSLFICISDEFPKDFQQKSEICDSV